jgi:hypothetical protein
MERLGRWSGRDSERAQACRAVRRIIERRYPIGAGGRILEPGRLFGVPLYALYYLARAREALGDDADGVKLAFDVCACERVVFPEMGDARRVVVRAGAGEPVEVWTLR